MSFLQENNIFVKYFKNYFENNPKEHVCYVNAFIRDDIMTIHKKGEKLENIKIESLKNLEGSDNPWCIYDISKFDISKIEEKPEIDGLMTEINRTCANLR